MRNRKIIGIISRLQKEKGQDMLIKSMPFVLKSLPEAQLVIIGEGGEGSLRKLASKLGISQKVTLKGFVEDKNKELLNFDLFVFPSRWELEGFGLAPIEAMARGVPVVTLKKEPMAEVLGDAAFYVENNPKSIAYGIVNVLKDSSLRKNLIKKGYDLAKHYSIDNISKKYAEIFDDLVKIQEVLES